MKTPKLFKMIFFFFPMIFFACNHNDGNIYIEELPGKWEVFYNDPNIAVDGFVTYTFNVDNTCSIYSYDVLSNRDTTIFRIYQISNNKDIITIFKENKYYESQYYIKKLNSKEMRWENTTPCDGNMNKMFKKIKE